MRLVLRGHSGRVTVALVVLLCGVLRADPQLPLNAPMRWDGVIEHLSKADGTGWGFPDGQSYLSRHPVSSDGRYIVFSADVSNGPYPSTRQLFRRDRQNGITEMIIGAQAANPPVISAEAHHVAFDTCEPWLRGDGLPICDVYVVDYRTFSLLNASTALDGTLSTDRSSDPVLSRDGRFVVFRTDSPTLLPPGAPAGQLMLRDRDADGNGVFDEPGGVTLEVVSVSGSGAPANAESDNAEVSSDGRFVAFRSRASNLVAGDTNGAWDVFLRDRATHDTRRINVGGNGQQATPTLDSPAISMSDDGNVIAFAADDGYLTDPPTAPPAIVDTNNALDVYVYDQRAGTLARLDVGAGGQLGNGNTYWPTVSADGRYVSMVSTSTNSGGLPGTPGRAHVYVYDRDDARVTRISVAPSGDEPDADSVYPVISSDGSFVVFMSAATNLVPGIPWREEIFGAARFDVAPTELRLPTRGGEVTATIDAQAYVSWSVDWQDYSGWVQFNSRPWGMGPDTLKLYADVNPLPEERTQTIHIGAKTIVVTQDPGLSLTGISPASGTPGTMVTLTGTAFEAGLRVFFDGIEAIPEIVNSTTLRVTAPPHAPGVSYVWVQTTDNRLAILYTAGFHYLDTTPPEIYSGVDGTLSPAGWYTSDVTVNFAVWDPESFVQSSNGCAQTVVTADTTGTTYTCTATSEGGTASASVTVRRDTTQPFIAISTPQSTLYRLNEAVNASISCGDTASGVAQCVGDVPNGSRVDTSTPGFHWFTAYAIDNAGNVFGTMRTYAVSNNMCTPRPDGLIAWWPGDYDYRDVIGGNDGVLINGQFGGDFAGGISRGSMRFLQPDGKYVQVGSNPALRLQGAMTLSAWIFSGAGAMGVIAGREGEYLLGRGADGHIYYSIANGDPGWGWIDTGVAIDPMVWTHVALTYDGAHVMLYVNGQVAYFRTATGEIGDALPDLNDFRIGARQLPGSLQEYAGNIDNVEVVNRALTDVEVQQAFLSADVGYCSDPTTLTFVPSTPHAPYQQPTSQLVAQLTRNGLPEANALLSFEFRGSPAGSARTDANGVAAVTVPFPAGWSAGTYANAAQVSVAGSAVLAATMTTSDFIVDRAMPTIAWNTPAPIVYGTALGSEQLNASSNTGGVFSYSPSFGVVLPAGMQQLTVTNTTSNPNYTSATKSVFIDVLRATPAVQVTGGTFTYDGQPHVATGTVRGVGGATVDTPTLTYNGSATPPSDAGTYAVVATFAGNQNYASASATTTITITKASAQPAWTRPASILYGTPLSATQLNATANVAGTFSYTPSAGAVLHAGSNQPLSLTFTPADSTNYAGGSVTTTIDVLPAPLMVRAVDASKVFGAPLPTFAAAITGFVNGDTAQALTGALAFATPANVQSAVGTYPIAVSGVASPNYSIAFAAGTLTVVRGSVTMGVSTTPEPSGANQPMTFRASLSAAAPASGAPTGTIDFYDGSTLLGSATILNGEAVLATAGLASGSHQIEARYGGDPSFAPLTASSTHVVRDASATPTLTLTSSRNPSSVGQSVTFTVNAAMSSGAVTGSVQFYDGATLLGTSTLSSGRATVTTASLSAGSHAVTVNYPGNGNTPPVRSPVLVQAVTGSNYKNRATTTTIASSANPATLGSAPTMTVTIGGSNNTSPTGRIFITVDGSAVGDVNGLPVTPIAGASARVIVSVPGLAHGSHTVTATYLGDATYKGSTAQIAQSVN